MSNSAGIDNVKKQLSSFFYSFEGNLNRIEFLTRMVIILPIFIGAFTFYCFGLEFLIRSIRWYGEPEPWFTLCLIILILSLILLFSTIKRRFNDLALGRNIFITFCFFTLLAISSLSFAFIFDSYETQSLNLFFLGIGGASLLVIIIFLLICFFIKGIEITEQKNEINQQKTDQEE